MLKKAYTKSKSTCKVLFSLPLEAAKNAREIKILGEFNHWNRENAPIMRRDSNTYQAELELEAGKSYQFRYLIDNHRWENDWDADGYLPTPFGMKNSVVSLH